ncbi:NAD(P)H-dependent flavin oxidoreductase [Bacillus infantis]|uniref:Probable nitronate monooxygenase n=1 Tax=Bacillus infantis TaxID=324767 RepID=A0A5D4R3R9_9BACI|nr:DUF561 domain-containing protein [Bacillus infantis]TYS45993.1 DUF561 domain-containing protein [Bacillus infantis]
MEWTKSGAAKRLGIQYPILQAPMAGGITVPELIAAVSGSGGLGNMGAGYMSAEDMERDIKKVKELTAEPYGVNLFLPADPLVDENKLQRMYRKLEGLQQEPGISTAAAYKEKDRRQLFGEQLETVLRLRVPIVSFTFGIPEREAVSELHRNGTVIIGTATNVLEAEEMEEAGADLVVAQGSEAGGHRGTFHSEERGLIGTMALIPQVADRVKIPVIAAGGIMDARGIAAAFMLGAQGVQLGTAFLPCSESGAHPAYKEAVLEGKGEETVLTKAFSGKLARGMENRFISEMKDMDAELLPFPVQNDLTGPIRRKAAKDANKDYMSLWAGQAVSLSKELPAARLMEDLIAGTDSLLKK